MDNANVASGSVSLESQLLESGAAALQDFIPLKSICAHLNAFHVYASDTSRFVETNHYCAHLTDEVRQCLLYDSAEKNAKLIGIEYMITPRLYDTLDHGERRLWHSHVFEVKSGMLVMPLGAAASKIPGAQAVWEAAETKEMTQVVELYGKVYHLWQTDKGHTIPLGEPQLMTSFTHVSQMSDGQDRGEAAFERIIDVRDKQFGTDWRRRRDIRRDIKEPKLHEEVDAAWRKRADSV